MESFERSKEQKIQPQWVRPNPFKETGEISRALRDFINEEPSVENLRRAAILLQSSPLTELSDEMWMRMENTDSFHNVSAGDLETAEKITAVYNSKLSKEKRCDFGKLLNIMQAGRDMDAPMVLCHGERCHLVSGNTRLMISRALGIRPRVIIGKWES